MKYLKQATASQSVLLGPFVDDTDGTTAETGLTIANTDIRVSKAGGNLAAKNSGGGTHDELGYYTITLDATDTATVGILQVICKMTGALVVEDTFQVLEENVYDALFGTSAALGTDIASILEDTGTTLDTKLDNIQGTSFNTSTDSLRAIRVNGDSLWTGDATTSDAGTAQAGAADTITLAATASTTNDIYNGQVIYISSGTGAGQSRAIKDYVGSTRVATVITNWSVNPSNDSVYAIYPDEITEITAAPTAAAIADAVWDENTTGHTQASTFGQQCSQDIDAILVDTQNTLDSAIAVIDANVDQILADTGTDGVVIAAAQTVATVTDVTNGVSLANGAVTDASLAGNMEIVFETDFATNYNTTRNAWATNAQDFVGTTAADPFNGTVVSASVTDSTAQTGDTYALANGATGFAAIDTVVDAVKAKTDSLNFTVPGQANVNVISINDVEITGDGGTTPYDVA